MEIAELERDLLTFVCYKFIKKPLENGKIDLMEAILLLLLLWVSNSLLANKPEIKDGVRSPPPEKISSCHSGS